MSKAPLSSPNAVEIIRADPTLLTAFALHHGMKAARDAFTDERASKFLLWFALEGRKRFHQVCFSPEYLAFLATPKPPFASRLAAYVALIAPDAQNYLRIDGDHYHAWYYLKAVPELGLGPLITPVERARLSEPHPAFAGQPVPLSRLVYYRFLVDETGPEKPDIRTDRGRVSWVRNLAAQPVAATDPLSWSRPYADRTALAGVNVIGFAEGVLGIGEDARAVVRVLDRAGIPAAVLKVDISDKIGTTEASGLDYFYTDRPIFPVNIFAITAFETARLRLEQGSTLFSGRYNIGYWPWELTSLPPEWKGVFDLVDEVWAPTGFLQDVYAGLTRKPVELMPFYLNPPRVEPFSLEEIGLQADEFVCLVMFDFNSFVARKNPYAAMDAFQRAFPDRNGIERLIVKTINSHAHPQALQQLEARIEADDRFVLIDGAMPRSEVCGLVASVDCLISLHRSEGFGRVLAEAMLLETIVVATDWSGSKAYLDETTGYPVAFTLRAVEPAEYPFSEGSVWAEPSIDDAARKLVLARDNRHSDGGKRAAARALVESRFGLDTVAEAMATRLAAVRRPQGI